MTNYKARDMPRNWSILGWSPTGGFVIGLPVVRPWTSTQGSYNRRIYRRINLT